MAYELPQSAAAQFGVPEIESLLTDTTAELDFRSWSRYQATSGILAVLRQVLLNQKQQDAQLAQVLKNQSAIYAAIKRLGPGPVASLSLTFLPLKETPMPRVIPDDGTPVYVKCTPLDAKDQPTTDPNPLNWSVSDPALLTVEPIGDGTVAKVAAVGPLGTAQVSVTDGTFTQAGDLQVVAGPVASFGPLEFSDTPPA